MLCDLSLGAEDNTSFAFLIERDILQPFPHLCHSIIVSYSFIICGRHIHRRKSSAYSSHANVNECSAYFLFHDRSAISEIVVMHLQ
jgi:hypothetical protein